MGSLKRIDAFGVPIGRARRSNDARSGLRKTWVLRDRSEIKLASIEPCKMCRSCG